MKKEIGDRIKEALEIRNMIQADLVEKGKFDKGQLSSWISGKYRPRQNNIALLAEILDVSEGWLMGYDVQMNSKLSPDEAWDKESQKVIDKVYAFDCQLKALGWEYKVVAEDDSSTSDIPDVYVLFTKGENSFKVSGNDYDTLINDTQEFIKKRLQKLLQKSIQDMFADKDHLLLNAAHERTDIEVTDEMRKHDDDIMDDENF